MRRCLGLVLVLALAAGAAAGEGLTGAVDAVRRSGPDGKGSQPAGMLLYEGVALPRGVLAWQGNSDMYDKRLHSYTWAMGPDGKV